MVKKESKRALPQGLKDAQETKRKKTVDKVQTAIDELIAEGYKVTMTRLVERTGLARATLSKPHIEEVLKENKVCKYEKLSVSSTTDKKTLKYELELENIKLKDRIEKVLKENANLKNKNNELKVENYELKDRVSKLLGELQLLSQKARMHGLRLELIKKLED